MDKSLASKYFNIGLRKNDPIGFNLDTYERVKKYTGIYAPLLQSITTAGDLALRGVTAAGLGTVGKLGDLTGQKQLSRDLAAMFLSAGGTMGSNLAFTKPISTTPTLRKTDAYRVDNLPITKPSIDQGLHYNIGSVAPQYASSATNVFPVVKSTKVPLRKASVDSARDTVSKIQKFEGRDPKLMNVTNESGQVLGTMYEGGRKINLPLSRREATEGAYRYQTVKSKLEEGKDLIPGSETYALSSSSKPFGTTAPIDKLKTITLNMKPEQRQLFFKRLLNPDARKEIMRVYPELTAIPLTALSTIATAAAIKKKD